MGKNEIISEALNLDPQERMELICALSDSLADEEDPSLSPEQAAELDRRVLELDRESSPGASWEDVQAQTIARLRQIRP